MGKGITQSREEAITERNRRIWEQARQGMGTRELAAEEEVSVRTVQRVVQAARKQGRVLRARKPGPARGTVLSATRPEQVRLVCAFKQSYPHKGHHYCHHLLKRRGLMVPAPVTIWRLWRRYRLMGRRRRRQRHRKWMELTCGPGYFQLDTMHLCGDRFAFVAVETNSRWAFARICAARTSAQAARFLQDLRASYPGTLRGVQTDNGSEFKRDFASACHALNLPHYFAWVRCPDQNGKVERFIRTLREESLLGLCDHSLPTQTLARDLSRFLHHYNHERLHHSLDWNTPAQYLATSSSPADAPIPRH